MKVICCAVNGMVDIWWNLWNIAGLGFEAEAFGEMMQNAK